MAKAAPGFRQTYRCWPCLGIGLYALVVRRPVPRRCMHGIAPITARPLWQRLACNLQSTLFPCCAGDRLVHYVRTKTNPYVSGPAAPATHSGWMVFLIENVYRGADAGGLLLFSLRPLQLVSHSSSDGEPCKHRLCCKGARPVVFKAFAHVNLQTERPVKFWRTAVSI